MDQPGTAPRHSFQPHCATCSLNSICLPIAVDLDEIEALDEIVQRGKPLQRGEHAYHAGEIFESVYAVRSGALKSYTVTMDGEEQITGFHLPGEIFGLGGLSSGRHPTAAVSLETSAVCEIPFAKVAPLSRELPSLQHHLFRLMSREITEDQQLMILLSKKSAEARIASLLLGLSSRFQRRNLSGRTFRLPMSRGDIGNYLGLVVETVSRVFTRLQRNGIVQVEGKEVTLLDPQQLAALAGTQLEEAYRADPS